MLPYKGRRYVIMNIAEDAANAALDAIGELMNGGSIELLSGEGSPLAVLKLSDPAAMPAADGELELNEISEEDAAFANGTATAARIVGRDGSEVFSCDCGDENSRRDDQADARGDRGGRPGAHQLVQAGDAIARLFCNARIHASGLRTPLRSASSTQLKPSRGPNAKAEQKSACSMP